MNHSEVDVCALISTKEEEDSFHQHTSAVEGFDNNIAFFFDPDECVEFILSIHQEKCLLILGKHQCHLVDIFSTLPCVFYIYLTEAQYYEDASRVRCIISSPGELLAKLKKDIAMLEKNDLNFSISPTIESRLHGSTTTDVRDDKLAFCYTHTMLLVLLHTQKPTNNIHTDMLKECRAAYDGNAKELEKIDEFAKTYESTKAISWYTKDSFLYRQLNAALRRANMLIIWKFRFIIQDIYRQVETLHTEQTKNVNGISHNTYRLYRGQHMTLNEFKQIKDNVGHLMAINSFLSTTKYRNLAEIWAGDGEDRPKLESVIFEIIIDESKFGDISIVFADITVESIFEEEREVLLAMGTTLLIESVEPEGNAWKICFCACPFEDRVYRELKTRLPKCDESLIFNENMSRLLIGQALLSMGEIEKAQQITQHIDQFEDPIANCMDTILKSSIEFQKPESDSTESNERTRLWENLSKMKESFKAVKPLMGFHDNSYLNRLQIAEKMIDFSMEMVSTSHSDISTFLRFVMPYLVKESQNQGLILENDRMRYNNSPRCPMEAIGISSRENEPLGLPNFEQIQSLMDQSFIKKNPWHNNILRGIAWTAAQENDNDKAIQCLQEALLRSCDDDQRAAVCIQLALIYIKQENWRAVLETCEKIFNMPKLSEKSPMLLSAHDISASLYQQFKDNCNALVHYKRAVELRCQHHSSHDPKVSADKMRIALIFVELKDMDAAFKIFGEVIELGHSKDTIVAYERMGLIYLARGDCDMAHYCFTQSLEMAQREVSPDIDLIIKNHLNFAMVEYILKHFDEADAHMNEAVTMSNNCQCTQRTKNKIQDTLDVLRSRDTRRHMTTNQREIRDLKHFS
ncbi:unnamed protein product [Rotaria socialis]